MKKHAQYLNIESFTALLTWMLVASSALWITAGSLSAERWWWALILYAVFIISFLAAIRDGHYRYDLPTRWFLIGLQFVAVLLLYWLVPFTYNAILMTIWSAQIVHFISLRTALLLSPLWSAPLWWAQEMVWHQSGSWLTAVLFWTFNLFALVMVESRRKEGEARLQAEQLNRELLATQVLLQAAARDSERTRIARNIHDLIGHHLTALTIHLQVAQRQADAQAQERIAKCHQIARLLLNDVRDAVSEMRQQQSLDVSSAIEALTRQLPEIQVHLDIQPDLPELSVQQADTMVRAVQECLTNVMRHSAAREVWIQLQVQSGQLQLRVKDNGSVARPVVPGNGLKGMRERIEALSGELLLSGSQQGFETTIHLPVVP